MSLTIKFFFMKSRTVFISIFAMLLNVAVFANNSERFVELAGSSVKISAVANTKAITVNVNNLLNDVLEVSLEDADGVILYTETAKNTNSFTKRLSLVNLDAGHYVLTIKKNLVKTVQPFELTATSVIISENERKEKFLPNITQKGNKLDVNVLLGKYSNVHVLIYDNEGRLVFEETNYVVLDLHKRFDLTKLGTGTYLVEVVAGEEVQYSTISL